jgi:hypothetical protein
MSKTPELDLFIKDSIKAGQTPDTIKSVLLQAGWDSNRIQNSLDYYYPADFPVAVPRPKTFASPRLFFLNLFYFLLVYLTVYNVISILFTMLDFYLPDGIGQYGSGAFRARSLREGIQDNVSIILVAAPMIYVTYVTIARAMRNEKQAIPRIRLILVYFTLFVGACVILGNASLFIYYFLRGELSIRFIIKIVILTVTVLGFYIFYKSELKHDEQNA